MEYESCDNEHHFGYYNKMSKFIMYMGSIRFIFLT